MSASSEVTKGTLEVYCNSRYLGRKWKKRTISLYGNKKSLLITNPKSQVDQEEVIVSVAIAIDRNAREILVLDQGNRQLWLRAEGAAHRDRWIQDFAKMTGPAPSAAAAPVRVLVSKEQEMSNDEEDPGVAPPPPPITWSTM